MTNPSPHLPRRQVLAIALAFVVVAGLLILATVLLQNHVKSVPEIITPAPASSAAPAADQLIEAPADAFTRAMRNCGIRQGHGAVATADVLAVQNLPSRPLQCLLTQLSVPSNSRDLSAGAGQVGWATSASGPLLMTWERDAGTLAVVISAPNSASSEPSVGGAA